MQLIKNLSLLILFFGIILLTIYLTKSYYHKNEILKEENIKKDEDAFLPSKQFASMFNDPSVFINPLQ